ncbi:E3 SUMO-protein ligase ZBED1-like [Tachypleus tridentatus]|uniref:E3 SUMO-protein ligase ZBED1-like n=1 Tax=Tachypleus tridentatus TaxID=6853 RepID=UPI003FD5C5BE
MLIQEVATRWNSTYQMLTRLLHLCVSVMAVLYDENMTKAKDRVSLVFDDAMWSVMEGAVEVLKPLAQATELLTKEKIPTSSSIYTILKHILTRLHEGQGSQGLQEMNGRDADVLTMLKARIVQGMITRFQVDNSGVPTTEPGLWSLAAILNPRYKRLSFFPYALRERIEDYLKEQLLRDSISEQDATHEQESPNISLTQEPVEPQTAESLIDCIQGDIAQSPSNRPYASIELELEAYLSEPISTSDPLGWWKFQENKFPRLAALAKNILCIPATEVSSKRAFCAKGLTMSKLRCSLDPENLDKITFLHKNFTFPERPERNLKTARSSHNNNSSSSDEHN